MSLFLVFCTRDVRSSSFPGWLLGRAVVPAIRNSCWFLVHVSKFYHISVYSAQLVLGKGPLPSHGRMARQRKVILIYLDIFALHVSIIIYYYVGEVMGDAPYVFVGRDGRRKMSHLFCDVFLYICSLSFLFCYSFISIYIFCWMYFWHLSSYIIATCKIIEYAVSSIWLH
jgi:hypothetical protein